MDIVKTETSETENARLLIENAALRADNERLKDLLLQSKRRIRVLRGNDTLTSASSRGVVIWLQAILEGAGFETPTKRHLKALIQTLSGED
jgi:hypothetical protein